MAKTRASSKIDVKLVSPLTSDVAATFSGLGMRQHFHLNARYSWDMSISARITPARRPIRTTPS